MRHMTAALLSILAIWAGFGGLANATPKGEVQPIGLKCEYAVNPLGIDTLKPRLFWQLESGARGEGQGDYRILVASSEEKLAADKGDLWDTGRVASSDTIQIEYAGKPLASRMKCYWKVRVWDRQGHASDWSAPATFEIALLEPGDWSARWITRMLEENWLFKHHQMRANEIKKGFQYWCKGIGVWECYRVNNPPVPSAPLYRKEFTIAKPVKKARVYVSGLGYYELSLNGCKVGDRVLDPALTDYDKKVFYATYDVTDGLKTGSNAVGVMVGRGWYSLLSNDFWGWHNARWIGQPKLILQMEIEYADGTSERIVSDKTWKVADGPIIFDDLRAGEIYDAQREKPGWDRPGYDDSQWKRIIMAEPPHGRLAPETLEPIKVTGTIQPVKLANPKPGVYVYDLGQNIAGWARLTAQGAAGTTVTLTFGEALQKDGTVDPNEGPGQTQQDSYILRGDGVERYEPRFTCHGFQYVQVDGFPGTPTIANIEGRVVHSAVETVGQFECSKPLLNQLQANIVRTRLNCLHGYPEDCPHRERMGWTGDMQVATEDAMFLVDGARLFNKWMEDLQLSQNPDGTMPSVAPTYGYGGSDSPTWPGAYLTLAWYMYRHYGDRRLLEQQYESMKYYVDGIPETPTLDRGRGLLVFGGWGDWHTPYCYKLKKGGNEATFIYGTAYYYRMAWLMERFATILNRPDDAKKYGKLAADIRAAMNRELFDTTKNVYCPNEPSEYIQSVNVIPLAMGMAPEGREQAIVDAIVNDIVNAHQNHLNTGILSTKSLMDVLCERGQTELAYRLATQTTFPSWGWHVVAFGATTIWETWDGIMSHDHAMNGVLTSYFFKWLAGIRLPEEGGAFERIIISPNAPGDLSYVDASLITLRGTVESHWKRTADHFDLRVTVPCGSVASVSVPKGDWKKAVVREGGVAVWDGSKGTKAVTGISNARDEGDRITFDVGSGSYAFEAAKAM